MLVSLDVHHFVLMDHVHLECQEGLTVLTGETGAGKSIILDALGVLLGGSFTASMRRQSMTDKPSRFAISGEFIGQESALDLLKEHDLINEEDPHRIVIRRTESRDVEASSAASSKGTVRLKNYVNDRPVTQNVLKSLAPHLLDIHGQFDRFFTKQAYRTSLDQFGNWDDLLTHVRGAYDAWSTIESRVRDLTQQKNTMDDRLFDIERTLEDLKKLSPKPGEETALLSERESLKSAAHDIHHFKNIDQLFGSDLLTRVMDIQKHARTCQSLPQMNDRLESIILELQDIQSDVRDRMEHFSESEAELNRLDDRLHALRRLARQYHTTGDDLFDLEHRLRLEKEDLEHIDILLHEATQQKHAAQKNYMHHAQTLHEARVRGANLLCQDLQKELPPLKLPHAQFHIDVQGIEAPYDSLTTADVHPHGYDNVTFLFSANPGMPLQDMGKTASGGEQSRLMLALKVVMHAARMTQDEGAHTAPDHPTLIFDEIDSGVSGSTSTAIGVRLKQLSKAFHTMIITHSPQITAFADHHYVVSKSVENGQTYVALTQQCKDMRPKELARMLSGADVTPESIRAAESLMAQASTHF